MDRRISTLLPIAFTLTLVGLGACHRTEDETGDLVVITVDASICSTSYDGGLDPTAVAAGRQLVTQFHCTGCHLPTLAGQPTPINGGYPSNLTPDLQTGIGCLTNDAIVTAILDGVGSNGNLCGMPHYRSKLSVDGGGDTETAAQQIVQYLRTVAPVSNRVEGPCGVAKDAGTD
jgi:hypothetical protein